MSMRRAASCTHPLQLFSVPRGARTSRAPVRKSAMARGTISEANAECHCAKEEGVTRSRLLVAFAAGAVAVAAACKHGAGDAGRSTPASASAAPSASPAATRSVLLFFADPAGEGLVAVRGNVAAASDAGTLANETLALLLKGPGALPTPSPGATTTAPPTPAIATTTSAGGLAVAPGGPPITALPAGVELRALFLDGKGTATVDLAHLTETLPGGTESETLALWSVVDTLAFNLPADARRVRILVDGHQVDALGHVALDAPLSPRRDLIAGGIPPPPGDASTASAPAQSPALGDDDAAPE